MKTSSFLKLSLIFILQFIYSCDKKASEFDTDEVLKIVKAEKVSYEFISNDLQIIIYKSKISDNKMRQDKSVLISSIFFEEVVLNKKQFSKDGMIKCIFKDGVENQIFEIKYVDLIILDNLEDRLYQILYSKSTNRSRFVKDENLLKEIDSVFNIKSGVSELSKIEIDRTYNLYLEFYIKPKTSYKFVFDKNPPYVLNAYNKVILPL